MSSILLQRRLCLPHRLVYSQKSCVSTSSAINRGLRASRHDQNSRSGDRDASRTRSGPSSFTQRPSFRDRKRLSEHVDVGSKPFRGHRERGDDTRFSPLSRSSPRQPDAFDRIDRGGRTRSLSDLPSRRHESVRSSSPPAAWTRRERMNEGQDRRGEREAFSVPRSRNAREETFRGPNKYSKFSTEHSRYSPNPTAEGHAAQSSDRLKPPEGLLKSIKKAVQGVVKMQNLEADGKDPNEFAPDVRHALKNVNSLISTGNFGEDEEPAEAVVSIFQGKAKPGTFLAGDLPDGKTSIIYVTQDGVIDLAVGMPGARRRPAPEENHRDRLQQPRTNQEATFNAKPSRYRDDEDDEIPVSVPYTTPSSEFLYGYNSVLAAFLGKRRKLYKLYVHPKIFEREVGGQGTVTGQKPAAELVELARMAGVPLRNEFKTAMLDKMSDGRPHNGVILEASKLPAPPVLGLLKPEAREGIIPLTLGEQNKEEAKVNGTPRTISALQKSWRHPFVVLVDGITDPGNLGNIIRTCHFFGVDAVAVATNTCANLSSGILAKASAGACEAMQILALPKPSNFVHDSSRYRWKVYAAVAPSAPADFAEESSTDKYTTTVKLSAESPLAQHPCILMLGAEGAGLRQSLRARADHYVSISSGPRADYVPDVSVDSMNVSVATGVLLDAFLRKPADAPAIIGAEELGF